MHDDIGRVNISIEKALLYNNFYVPSVEHDRFRGCRCKKWRARALQGLDILEHNTSMIIGRLNDLVDPRNSDHVDILSPTPSL